VIATSTQPAAQRIGFASYTVKAAVVNLCSATIRVTDINA
jgi:hypothetical protein